LNKSNIKTELREAQSARGAQGAGRNGRPLLLAHAACIVAEILFCRTAAKKIGADSPVRGVCAANAQK
jgi:hypothetical protein